MSQTKLSDATGISKPSISEYCSGKSIPSKKGMEKITEALGYPITAFGYTPRKLEISLDELENIEKVSVTKAASLLGKSIDFVRNSLEQGVAPFGFAVKMSTADEGIYDYYISPGKLYNFIKGA